MNASSKIMTRPTYKGRNPFKLLTYKLPLNRGEVIYYDILTKWKENQDELSLYKALKGHESALRSPLIRYNLFWTYIWLTNYHLIVSIKTSFYSIEIFLKNISLSLYFQLKNEKYK